MKQFFATLFFLSACTAVSANDGVFYAMGNTLIPVKETVVRMDKEILGLRQNDGYMEVSVHFEFFNPGPEKEEIVGFVTPPAGGDIDEGADAHPQIKDFTVVVNGQSLAFQTQRMEESGFQLGEEVASGYDFVYHFKVRFKEGKNIIKHTYSFRLGSSVENSLEAYYRLTTGAMWANGKIGNFSLSIDLGPDVYFSVPYSFQADGTSADWKIEGTGKVAALPHTIFDETRRMVTIQSGKLALQQFNFVPERDLAVKVYNLHNEIMVWRDDSGEHPFTNLFDLMWLYEGTADRLTELTDEELRLLRNYFYAREGYVFKSEDLKALFSSFNWYLPDPALQLEEIQLGPDEKKIVELIVAEEKRRKG